MNKYKNFSTDDFVLDDFFCAWVISPNEETNQFWKNWQQHHPHKKTTIEEARTIVLTLKETSNTSVSKDLLNTTWSEIESQTTFKITPVKKTRNWLAWAAAAAAVVLLVMGIKIFYPSTTTQTNDLVNTTPKQWKIFKNSTSSVKRIELADGSNITVEPQGLVKYPSSFDGKNRTVVLEGEAFFEIARDTTKPFYVYANATVIRVLGTSFFVKAKEKDKEVEVVVRTGKVAVYKRKDIQALQKQKVKTEEVQPLLVTPNQKVVFDKVQESMTRRLTSTPSLVKPLSNLPKLRFEEASVTEIFEALENAYGVEIIYEATTTTDCTLNTTLTEETLFEKLDIVCASSGLKYYEEDAKIVIEGQCE